MVILFFVHQNRFDLSLQIHFSDTLRKDYLKDDVSWSGAAADFVVDNLLF
jgi:hypothetical protein